MKRLYRSRKEKVLCGVCGGLAEYLNIDPIFIRLAAVALFVANPGVAIILYIAACVLMPEAPEATASKGVEIGSSAEEAATRIGEAGKIAVIVIGAILIAVGVSLIMQPVAGWDVTDLLAWLWNYLTLSARFIAGIALAAVGIVLIVAVGKKRSENVDEK